jgi:hypothetical protein
VEVYDDDYGEKWFSDERLPDDLLPLGPPLSVSSEVGRLRACLVRRRARIRVREEPRGLAWGD